MKTFFGVDYHKRFRYGTLGETGEIISRQVLAVAVVWISGASGIANATDVTVSVNNKGSFSQHAITVRPGDTFSIDVTVSTTVQIFDMYDMKLLAGGAGVLTVTGGSVQAPWTDPGVLPVGELNLQSASFEVLLPDPDFFGPGESTLVTLNLAVNGDASPGTLTLNVIDGKWSPCRPCPAFGNANSGPDFIVEVFKEAQIPTVSTWGMTALVLLVMVAGTVVFKRVKLTS